MTESSTEQDARTEPEGQPLGNSSVDEAGSTDPQPAEVASVESTPLAAGDVDGPWLNGEFPAALSGVADPVESGTPDPADDSDGDDSAAVVAEVDDSEADEAPISGEALLVQEGEIAGDYLEQLLDILDYDGDIDLDVEGSRAIVAIVGANDLDPLVGARGVTLDALQELTRLTVAQQTGVRTRLMLDIGGYRAGRRTELSELAAASVTKVIDTGETVRMSPMNAFERKIVHDVVTATDGVRSESEGEDPDRRVVILRDR